MAALPGFLAANDTELIRLDASMPAPVRQLWLVVHADLRRAPAIRAVMNFIATLVTESGAFSPAPRSYSPVRVRPLA